ncbi:MAG TPA: hypothetical protein VD793_08580, partial [Gemmatimonadales bacterium]|nr:hypothetical protein [Gemmatimonadales bacterium]
AHGEWSRWPMTAADSTGSVSAFLLDLDQPTEFFVEAGGVRSPVVRVNVVDLPYVRSIALEYRFPVYTGLTPQRVEGTGDVAAVVGTVVRVEVTPTIPPRGGVLVVDGRDTVVLQPRDSGLAGEIRVSRSGSYRVLFDAVGGGRVAGSPEYLIDALVDQPPLVRFSEPGRDLVVTSVEEVAARLTAEDDYGVAALELRFSVNGGEERRVSLLANGRRKEAAAGHTFYLEEFRLEPGDFVSYHGRATEAGRAGAAQEAVTDMYFLEVRPFDRVYRQADQAPGGGGGGGGGMAGELSERQRQVVAGTFNLVRDRARYDDAEQRKHLTTLALSQGRLREEVSTLKSRIEERGIAQLDSTFRGITEALGGAIQEMEGAEELLGERKAEEALGPEQRALKHLQRAEATFREVQVARGQQGGGGGGRGEGPNAEELADLFDLEMDRLGNQYERLERGAREEADQQLDELMEKLRELSRRQQQENERARARAEQMASGAGGTGEAQRRLAQETEDMARRLERLAREQSRPELNESARRLREAAESMRRAAAQGTDGSAQGRSALDELRDARRLLERDRSVGLRGQVDDALRRATRLAEQQREMESAVGELGGAAPDPARVRRLQERKTEMATELEGLERDLDRLAQQSRRDQREASGKLADAARFIRDAKIREKMLYSRGIIQGRSPDYARNFEQQIGDELDQVRQQVADAAGSVGETREQRVARALDQTRDLVRSLESVSDRMGEQGQPGQRDQEARPGQQGDRGREGQQGQGGQQGQEGQPGQGQRGADGGRDLGGPGGWGQGRYDPRQWSRDLRQGIADARELRRLLSAEGVDVRDLDGYIGRLRELDGRSSWGDPEAQRTLELEVIQGLKEFEFALRRQIEGGDQQRLFLSGSDEVPEGYRRLVERYYRALSEGRAR